MDANIINEQVEEDWIRQKISFRAAYGDEEMIVYMFLPKRSRPPFQTVVYWPGGNVSWESKLQTRQFEFLMKSGRAVMCPIYLGSYERRREEDFRHLGREERKYLEKERRIKQILDLRRSMDYLESREDIDSSKLAFLGVSWGSIMAPIALSVDNRFKAAVLVVAGLTIYDYLPEVDERHYLPFVRTPVLMLNGRYDNYVLFETSQLPFFELLGTPETHKDTIFFDRGHQVPKVALMRESLTWLDRYLGPVDTTPSGAIKN